MKNLFYHIDVYSGLPVYRQLMDQTKHYIASGTLLLGDQLPSIRELSTRLSINPATIVKAYSELQTSGVVEIKQGKGAFVAQGKKKKAFLFDQGSPVQVISDLERMIIAIKKAIDLRC